MVLMDAARDLPFPNPSTSELITVAAFVEKNVPGLKQEGVDLIAGHFDVLDLGKVKSATKHISHAQIRYGKRVLHDSILTNRNA